MHDIDSTLCGGGEVDYGTQPAVEYSRVVTVGGAAEWGVKDYECSEVDGRGGGGGGGNE